MLRQAGPWGRSLQRRGTAARGCHDPGGCGGHRAPDATPEVKERRSHLPPPPRGGAAVPALNFPPLRTTRPSKQRGGVRPQLPRDTGRTGR